MGKTHRYHKTEKPAKKELTISQYELYKSTRKDWGELDPRTKIKGSDKAYKRAKAKKEWRQEIEDY